MIKFAGINQELNILDLYGELWKRHPPGNELVVDTVPNKMRPYKLVPTHTHYNE